MNRRHVLAAGLTVAFAPQLANAQLASRRIGFLLAVPPNKSVLAPIVMQRLAELGYADGKSARFVHRSADGEPSRFPQLARELIDANCDVIFAIGPEYAPRALKAARTSIPVVFFANDYDPLQASVVDNLARPGANITGVYVLEPELVGKRLQLIREALPTARRVLVFSDPFSTDQLASVQKAAQAAGLEVTLQEFANPPYDLVSALERAASVDALMVMTSPMLFAQAATLRAPLAKRRLPSIAAGPYVNRGILFGFGAIIDQLLRRAAEMGVAILDGASPGAIPVEQAREFEFIINAGVAREIGLRIPQALLARATHIVQ